MVTLNLTTPINCTSYGYIGQNLVKAFINKGIEVNLEPIGPMEIDVEAGYGKYIEKCGNQLDKTASNLIIWHYFGLHQFIKPGQQNIGFPVFEVNAFSPEQIQSFRSCNKIIVASKWYEDILSNIIQDIPIYTIPLGFDPEVFVPNNIVRKSDVIRFIHVGKAEIRKGLPELIKCFGEEFKNDCDVSLTLVCHNPFLSKEENGSWKHYAENMWGKISYYGMIKNWILKLI